MYLDLSNNTECECVEFNSSNVLNFYLYRALFWFLWNTKLTKSESQSIIPAFQREAVTYTNMSTKVNNNIKDTNSLLPDTIMVRLISPQAVLWMLMIEIYLIWVLKCT